MRSNPHFGASSNDMETWMAGEWERLHESAGTGRTDARKVDIVFCITHTHG